MLTIAPFVARHRARRTHRSPAHSRARPVAPIGRRRVEPPQPDRRRAGGRVRAARRV